MKICLRYEVLGNDLATSMGAAIVTTPPADWTGRPARTSFLEDLPTSQATTAATWTGHAPASQAPPLTGKCLR
jgi:hypothetical protein